MTNTTIRQRIKIFAESKGFSENKIAKESNLSKGTLSQESPTMRTDAVEKIHRTFPDLNIMWLLFEEGGMLVEDNPQDSVEIAVLREKVKHQEALLAEKDRRLAEKDERIAELKASIADLRAIAAQKETRLELTPSL